MKFKLGDKVIHKACKWRGRGVVVCTNKANHIYHVLWETSLDKFRTVYRQSYADEFLSLDINVENMWQEVLNDTV